MSEWTNEASERLRQLWEQRDPQLSTAAIGRLLGTSKNAAVGRAARMGLARRPSPILPGNPNSAPRVPRGARITLPSVVDTSAGQAVCGETSSDGRPAPEGGIGEQRPSLCEPPQPAGETIRGKHARPDVVAAAPATAISRPTPVQHCCWPLGDPRAPSFRFCEAPAVQRQYCDEHAKVAFINLKTRRKRAAADTELHGPSM